MKHHQAHTSFPFYLFIYLFLNSFLKLMIRSITQNPVLALHLLFLNDLYLTFGIIMCCRGPNQAIFNTALNNYASVHMGQ